MTKHVCEICGRPAVAYVTLEGEPWLWYCRKHAVEVGFYLGLRQRDAFQFSVPPNSAEIREMAKRILEKYEKEILELLREYEGRWVYWVSFKKKINRNGEIVKYHNVFWVVLKMLKEKGAIKDYSGGFSIRNGKRRMVFRVIFG